MSDRELAVATIQGLPPDTSLEEASDELALLAALRKAVRQADEGKVRSHGEVKNLLEDWLSE